MFRVHCVCGGLRKSPTHFRAAIEARTCKKILKSHHMHHLAYISGLYKYSMKLYARNSWKLLIHSAIRSTTYFSNLWNSSLRPSSFLEGRVSNHNNYNLKVGSENEDNVTWTVYKQNRPNQTCSTSYGAGIRIKFLALNCAHIHCRKMFTFDVLNPTVYIKISMSPIWSLP